MRRVSLASVLSTIILVESPAAFAQYTNDDAGFVGLEEVVVTAQKREQNLQDVPIAVTPLSADVLDSFRVTDAQGLNGLAPNLMIISQGSPSTPYIIIRGITSGAAFNAVDPKVGLYIDGVYVGRSTGALFDLADIERVEVLRGPQGTLFGRNATGGAVSLVTSEPTGELGIEQDVSFGNRSAVRTRTTLNLPQIGGLSLKASYLHDERDGYVRNLAAGQTLDIRGIAPQFGLLVAADTLGAADTDAFLLAARLEATDTLTFNYKFDYTDSEKTAPPNQVLGFVPGAGGNAARAIYAAQPALGGFTQVGDRPLASINNFSSAEPLTVEGHALTATWRPNDSLRVSSITGYREYELEPNIYDYAASGGLRMPSAGSSQPEPFFVLAMLRASSQRQFSQELQLDLTTDAFDLTAGAFYFRERAPALDPVLTFQVAPGGVVDSTNVSPQTGVSESIAENDSIAVYAQGTWRAADRLDLTLGVRYSEDSRDTRMIRSGGAGAGAMPPGVYSTDYSRVDYTAIATYHFSDDILGYAKAATGYVAGGVVTGITFDPEKLTSYEIGMKSSWADNRVRANLAAYFMDYEDFQINSFSRGFVEYQNAGQAESYGLEVELNAALTPALTASATLGYQQFDYVEYLVDVTQDGAVIGKRDVADVAKTARTPEWNGRLSLQYALPRLGQALPFARLDARWISSYDQSVFLSGDPALDSLARTDAHWVVNGRLGLEDFTIGDMTVRVSLWSQNLLNERDTPIFAPNLGTVVVANFIEPRTYGIDFTLKF